MSEIGAQQGTAGTAGTAAGLTAGPGARERAWVWGIIAVVFLINLLTASRSPTVWKDEVMFVDPAVNWVMGNGFVSTAWPGQSYHTTWASNAPLHSMLLCPWLKVFGISPTAGRSVNFVYISIAAYLCWLAAARGRWIRTPRNRILLVALILLGNGVSFAYRSGRYDTLAMLVLSSVGFLSTVRNPRARMVGLLAAGFLAPWTGLHTIPFLAIMGVVLPVCLGWRTLRMLVPMGIGMVAGGAAFYGYLHAIGAWSDFLAYTSGMQATPHSEHFVPPDYYHRTLRTLADITETRDYSLIVMAGLLIIVVAARRALPLRVVAFGFATAFLVPVAFAVAYTFASYYTWMVYIPLTVAVLALGERGAPRFNRGAGTLAAGVQATVLGGVMMVGLPARLGLMAKEWQWRDYSAVGALVQSNLNHSDVALISPLAYYPVKLLAGQTFLEVNTGRMTPQEIAAVTVVVLEEEEVGVTTSGLPGHWRRVAAMPPPPGSMGLHRRHLYALVVLRRDDGPSATQP